MKKFVSGYKNDTEFPHRFWAAAMDTINANIDWMTKHSDKVLKQFLEVSQNNQKYCKF